MTANICPDVMQKDLRKLAASVVLQAVTDAKNTKKRLEDRLDAILFLTGDDIGFWLEWAGMPHAVNPLTLFANGTLRKSQTRQKNGRKE